MRKLTTLALVFLLLICGTAHAEISIDLSAMTLDELVELHKLLDAEIDARIGCEPSLIPAGIYVGGETIKPGKYIISTNSDYYGAKVATFSSMAVYDQALAENNQDLATIYIKLGSDDSVFVQVEEGTVLHVSTTALIEEAKEDWMP